MANPFYQAMMGNAMTPPMRQPMQMSGNPVMNILMEASRMYQNMQNPLAFVNQYFPNVPENYRNDPDKILQYLQQTGMITPQQIAFLNQFSCPVR